MDLTELRGVVAAGSPETATAGAELLSQGGTTVDVAVAPAHVSFVAECTIAHTGGAGFALVYPPDADPFLNNFLGAMPAQGGGGTTDLERLDFHEVSLEYAATLGTYYIGPGAVAVPGNVARLCALAHDCARTPLSTCGQAVGIDGMSGQSLAAAQHVLWRRSHDGR